MLKISLLIKLNLNPEYVYETIVTTYTEDNLPNAAPMGIKFLNDQSLIISPFLATQTFKNIEKYECAVINFIYDLEIFFESVFSEGSPKLPLKSFEKATKVNAPQLKVAIAHVEIRTREIKKETNRSQIVGEIITWDLSSVPFIPLNRGYNLVLESIIHTTRILAFRNDIKKVQPLINLVNQYQKLIEKVAPTGTYIEIMEKLRKKIGEK